VYVRNCKLEMLVRSEATPANQRVSDEEAPAAEWRWALAQVDDGRATVTRGLR